MVKSSVKGKLQSKKPSADLAVLRLVYTGTTDSHLDPFLGPLCSYGSYGLFACMALPALSPSPLPLPPLFPLIGHVYMSPYGHIATVPCVSPSFWRR